MFGQRAWIVRSNGCIARRTNSGPYCTFDTLCRAKRRTCLQLVRQNSTSKWLPNPYWSSKATSSAAERLQKRSRLVSGALSLAENMSAFFDGQLQRASMALQSRAALKIFSSDDAEKKRRQRQTFLRLGVQEGHGLVDSEGGSAKKMVTPARSDLSLADFVRAREGEVDSVLAELEVSQKRAPPREEDPKDAKSPVADVASRVPVLSQLEMDQKTRHLLKAVVVAKSSQSQLARLTELNDHILNSPRSQSVLIKERAIAHLLQLREYSSNEAVVATARETLALLGYVDPPKGRGIRILAIDGGGTKGMLAIEMLHQLELSTGRRVFELFDYVVGVSTGAILSFLLAGLHTSLDRCESLYRRMSLQVFTQNAWWGTGRLVWSHAYYDTSYWADALREVFEDNTVLGTTRHHCSPKVAAVSIAVNQPLMRPYVFRNYNLPYRVESHYYGSCKYQIWQAIRASGAAPGYFEEYELDGIVHQDGGLMVNNPTAVAIHEAKLLWPREHIQCVVSLGGGRFIPASDEAPQGLSSLKSKVLKVIESATDTEAVHTTVQDLLPSGAYFRFNPYLSEQITLDETRAEKLDQLKQDAQMYLRRNSDKFNSAVESLCRQRTFLQRLEDWLRLQAATKW
ncbi:unnamed protein product [Ixodes hexagonus]